MIAITGPTASGKSALAVEYAASVGGEVVSVDSRQIYRGLDVGTAKPTADERRRVPHHLIDEADPSEPLSAGAYAQLVNDRIDEVLARGAVPVLAGGSTLYLDAVVHGIADLEVPGADGAVSADELASPEARERLYAELANADPDAAATLDATKTQRLSRLVGILRATGRPPSAIWAEAPPPRHAIDVVVLDRPRQELYDRIDRRVDQMLADGLVEENRRLLALGLRLDRPPLRTIGYAEVIDHLEGRIDEAEMVRLIKRNTRRYAKRQLTWFRRKDYTWLSPADATVERLAQTDRKSSRPAPTHPTPTARP